MAPKEITKSIAIKPAPENGQIQSLTRPQMQHIIRAIAAIRASIAANFWNFIEKFITTLSAAVVAYGVVISGKTYTNSQSYERLASFDGKITSFGQREGLINLLKSGDTVGPLTIYCQIEQNTSNGKNQTANRAPSLCRFSVDMENINLSKSTLINIELADLSLRGSNFSGITTDGMVRFDSSDLRGANFRNANLNTAVFIDADLEEADFTDADLSGANFSDRTLPSLEIVSAKNITQNQVDKACISGKTPKLPEGIKPPSKKCSRIIQ